MLIHFLPYYTAILTRFMRRENKHLQNDNNRVEQIKVLLHAKKWNFKIVPGISVRYG
jgi:hypothetical protein